MYKNMKDRGAEVMKHKLPTEVKERWTTALRSGDYKQGRNFLRNKEDGYCCLGVLADVCGLTWKQEDNTHEFVLAESGSGSWLTGVDVVLPAGMLPAGVMEALEQEVDPPNSMTVEGKLGNMNDIAHMKFSQIADWIEENL